LTKGRIAVLSSFAMKSECIRTPRAPGRHIRQRIGTLRCNGLRCTCWPQKCPSCGRICSPKRHRDRFSRFSQLSANPCAQHRHTYHATCDICSKRLHLCTACMRCGL